mmetsp:Transcript_1419/g.2010  ORF Transcript_1419/g.2010 Transcript_1419/m.2010 type:complete len:399 (+) Transcript_1419:42-1238(+)
MKMSSIFRRFTSGVGRRSLFRRQKFSRRAFGACAGLATAFGASWVLRSAEAKQEQAEGLYLQPNDEQNLRIFSGNGNPVLANEVAMLLGCQLGRATISKFADGEVKIRFYDSVRGKHVYIIQPTSFPPNDNLMELLLMISTLRRASAETITAILPYYGYSRQLATVDKEGGKVSLAAADVAIMLKTVGVDQVISVDLHKNQIEGFFDHEIIVDNLDVTRSVVPYLVRLGLKDPVFVPIGRVKKTKYLRDSLAREGIESDMGFVFYSGKAGFENVNEETHPDENDSSQIQSHRTEFVGDVKDKDVLIHTDLIDTGSRVTSAANHIKRLGARRIFALSTHGLLTGNSIEAIQESALDEVVLFNTIPLRANSPKLRTLSVAPLIAETIKRIDGGKSVVDLK